jgi:uncharacterized protein
MIKNPMVQDLLNPGNLPAAGPVEFRQTHASFVFLAGDSAFKIKRSKDYGFFDFRALADRRHFCEEEVRLNRRTAAWVYHGVLPVYRDAGGHSLTRPGEIVDYAVHMARLPADRDSRAILRAGSLGHAQIEEIARTVARFHAAAGAIPGHCGAMRRNIAENFSQVEPFVDRYLPRDLFLRVREAQERWLLENRELLESRPFVDGHGDLRLEHIYLVPQGITIIDCIEFLDRFRIADPALDAAFLAMDLGLEGFSNLAEHFLGRYADESDDYGFYPLADGYVSYRAWVRGKVSCFLAADPMVDPSTARKKAQMASHCFDLADRAIMPRTGTPLLLGVGGLIATGKTTLSEALARRLAIPAVSADATRKHLAGLPHESPGGQELYTDAFTSRVQEEFLARADHVLSSGRSAIIDTTFSSRSLRLRAWELARFHRGRFVLLECRAPETLVRERLRRRTGGVSDAREDLFDKMAQRYEPVLELSPAEHHVVDMEGDREASVERVLKLLA